MSTGYLPPVTRRVIFGLVVTVVALILNIASRRVLGVTSVYGQVANSITGLALLGSIVALGVFGGIKLAERTPHDRPDDSV